MCCCGNPVDARCQLATGVVSVCLPCLPCCIISLAAFTINPLPLGYSYSGPSGGIDDSNMCKCNTVSYSLLSACDPCQGSDWMRFDLHAHLPSSEIPVQVPVAF